MGSKKVRILCISTNGIMNDGITSWMRTTFGVMDRTGLELMTTSFKDVPEDVVSSVEASGFSVIRVPSRKAEPLSYATAFRRILDEGDFDIVHVSCNSALATFELREARRHGVPMRIAHSHNTTCQHRLADRLLRPAFYCELTDRYACGRDAGRWLFGNRPFTVIPNGKELGDWAFSTKTRSETRSELGLSDGEVAVGHVGRFNEQKNHQKLLRVFAELHKRSEHYRLVLIGDGELVDRAKTLASELGVAARVSFLGRRGDVPRLLNAMDCMVLPSLYEGFPNVVLEWQLSGLPVVMSDTVTDDVAITSLVSHVPLSASDAAWADAVERSLSGRNRVDDSKAARGTAKEQGYDIHDDAALLRGLYLQGVTGCH